MTERRLNEKPACSVKSFPFPEEIKCPGCGRYIEVWSDEEEAECSRCRSLLKKEG